MRTKGTPTDTNIFVLAKHFEGRDRAPSRVASVHFHHLKRRLVAGLCRADGTDIVLTDAGKAAIAARGAA